MSCARLDGNRPSHLRRALLLTAVAVSASIALPVVVPQTARASKATENNWQGFDTCAAQPLNVMWDFWNGTPFFNTNIYFGGASRGCKQPNLTTTWVKTVTGQTSYNGSFMHYDIIPTYVGAEPAFSASGTSTGGCQTSPTGHYGEIISSNLTTAASQGKNDADNATYLLNALGLGGSVIYLDIEQWNQGWSWNGVSCETMVRTYVNAFIHEVFACCYPSYSAGVYGNPNAAMDRFKTLTNIPDDIWTADFGGAANVWGISGIPDADWSYDQRISQWNRNKNTKDGVSIDNDCSIADLAYGNNPEPNDSGTESAGTSGEDPHCNS